MLLISSYGYGMISADDDANRPQMILDCNKDDVNQLKENLVEFFHMRKAVRWPMLVCFNVVDVLCYNAFSDSII